MPETGGLTLVLLTAQNSNKMGKPSSILHLLPMEVLAFLSICPFIFLNQRSTPHVYWTGLAALLNFKTATEKFVELQDRECLQFVLENLKGGEVMRVLFEINSLQDEDYVPLDVQFLHLSKFRLLSAGLGQDGAGLFGEMLLNLVFVLKFKLLNFENSDSFEERGEIAAKLLPEIVLDVKTKKLSLNYLPILSCQSPQGVGQEAKTKKSVRKRLFSESRDEQDLASPQPRRLSVESEPPKKRFLSQALFDSEQKTRGPLTKEATVDTIQDSKIWTPPYEKVERPATSSLNTPTVETSALKNLTPLEEFDILEACASLFSDSAFLEPQAKGDQGRPKPKPSSPVCTDPLEHTQLSEDPPTENDAFVQLAQTPPTPTNAGPEDSDQSAPSAEQATEQQPLIGRQNFDITVRNQERTVTISTQNVAFTIRFE